MELQRVGTSPSVDHIAGVTRVPKERIRVVTEQHAVVALSAADDVTSWASQNDVVARITKERVVTGSPDQNVVARATRDAVVAATTTDGKRFINKGARVLGELGSSPARSVTAIFENERRSKAWVLPSRTTFNVLGSMPSATSI
jgi:hypothetical protein